MWQVYRLTCSITGKSYVGKGNGKNRWRDHRRNARKGVQTHLCRAICKHGVDSFSLSIEGEFENQHEAYAYEALLIEREDLTRLGYNEVPGMKVHVDHDQVNISRAATVGKQWTPERRRQRSQNFIGEGNPFFGKHHSKESRNAISKAVILNVEAHRKISQALQGHTVSKKTRKKMSESSPTRGKSLEEAFGHERADQIKRNLKANQPDRRGENHPNTKLSNLDVINIRKRSVGFETDIILAEEYNVTPKTIYKIRRRETWKHIP